MKLYLAIPLALAVVLAGGCVSKSQYDEALAANRRLKAAHDQALAESEELKAANAKLAEDLKDRDAALQAKQAEIALLEQAQADLQASLAKLQKLYDEGQSRPGDFVVVPPVLDQALREFAQNNPDLVDYLPNYGMVKFKSDLTFEKGKDVVQPDAVKALDKFVEILNSPAARAFHVYVAGHTDNIPISKPETLRRHPDNWYLSVHRAVAVEQILAKAGLAPERIGAMGFGEYHPIAPNGPAGQGNAANRRVEIWIVPANRLLTLPSVGGSSAAPAAKAAEPASTDK